MAKRKLRPILCFILAFFMLFQSITPSLNFTYADKSDKEIVTGALGGSKYSTYEDATNEMYLDKDLKGKPLFGPASMWGDGSDNLDYFVWRVFRKGYIYDIREKVDPISTNEKAGYNVYDEQEFYTNEKGTIACDPSRKRDGGYLYHNCDLPNVITGVRQAMLGTNNTSPIINGQITTAVEHSGLGIPANIPEGGIPVYDYNDTDYDSYMGPEKATGLELFGYNLKNSIYRGEWDQLDVNTSARLLANYGMIDKLRLTGKSIGSGMKAFAQGLSKFDWNPITWIGGALKNAAGGALMPILDTFDANVVATRGWARPTFGSTMYSDLPVKYIPNKLVAERTMRAYETHLVGAFDGFIDPAIDRVYEDKKVAEARKKEIRDSIKKKELYSFVPDNVPPYIVSYKAQYKTGKGYDAYQQEREAYKKIQEEHLTCKRMGREDCGELPDPPVKGDYDKYTSKEQFAQFQPNVAAFLEQAKKIGGIENPLDDTSKTYEDYGVLKNDYTKNFKKAVKKEFLDKEWVEMEVEIEEDHEAFLFSDPKYSPDREISHWICIPTHGRVPKPEDWSAEEIINAPQLFTDEFTEEINTRCGGLSRKKLRPTIKGGAQGSGDLSTSQINDTRWQVFNSRSQSIYVTGNTEGISKIVGTFFNKVLNTLLSFSFDDVLKRTGLTGMITKVIEELRDGIYFPLITLAMAISAFFAIFKMTTTRSATNILKALGGLLAVYTIGMILLHNPERTLELVDVIPRTVDNLIMNAMYGEEQFEHNPLCSTDGDKIRSVQCEVWQIGVFNPWMMNQFGTSDYKMLNIDKMEYDDDTRTLIGAPKVVMGRSFSSYNWAFYQLNLTKSGSITTKNINNDKDGTLDTRMYKLVDMQYGPNNGAGKDKRFADAWSGLSRSYTWTILALVINFLMLVIIGKFILYKLQISFSLMLNFMLLPFIALLGLFPGGGRRFKDHLTHIIGLFFRRTSITFFLVLLLKFLVAGINTHMPIVPLYIYSIAILLAFKHFWMDYLKLIDSSVPVVGGNGGLGSKLASGDYIDSNDVRNTIMNSKLIPKGVDQVVAEAKAKGQGVMSGTIAGSMMAMKTREHRKNGDMKVSYYENVYNKKTGKYERVKKTRNATAFDVIKENVAESAGKEKRERERVHRREGFGFNRNMRRVATKVSNELAYELSGGGRTADTIYLGRAYSNLRNYGITFSQEDLIKNKKVQKLIREYSRLMEQEDLILQIKPENAEEVVKQAQEAVAVQEKMRAIENGLTVIRDDIQKKKGGVAERRAKAMMDEQIIFEYQQTVEARENTLESFKRLDMNNRKIQFVEERANNILEENLENYQQGRRVTYDSLSEEDKEKLRRSSYSNMLGAAQENSQIKDRISALMEMSEKDGMTADKINLEIDGIIRDVIRETGDTSIIDYKIPYDEMKMMFVNNIDNIKNDLDIDAQIKNANYGSDKKNHEEAKVNLEHRKLTPEEIRLQKEWERYEGLSQIEQQDLLDFNERFKRKTLSDDTNQRSLASDRLKLFNALRNEKGQMSKADYARFVNFLRNEKDLQLNMNNVSSYSEPDTVIEIDKGKTSDYLSSNIGETYKDFNNTLIDYYSLSLGKEWTDQLKQVSADNEVEFEKWREEYEKRIKDRLS